MPKWLVKELLLPSNKAWQGPLYGQDFRAKSQMTPHLPTAWTMRLEYIPRCT